MSYRNALLIVFLICLLPAGRVTQAATKPPAPAPAPAPGFTPITTHIEADPWRVLRIEKAEPMAPRDKDVSTSGDNQTATINLNWFGLIDLQKHWDPQDRLRSMNIGFVRIPLFRMFYINRDGALIWADDWVMRLNWYWFALMDGVIERNYDKKNALGHHETYMRVAFFDAPLIFTGYKYKFEAPQRAYWEALDLPLSNTISHKTDKDKNEWRVLNVPLFWAWRYDHDGTETTTNFLATAVGSVYERETKPNDDRWSVLSIPFLTLVDGKTFHGTGDTTLLKSMTVHDNALFFLWRKGIENNADESFKIPSRQYLKLPFLGPVYASWTDAAGPHRALFPKLFRWKQAPDSIRTIF